MKTFCIYVLAGMLSFPACQHNSPHKAEKPYKMDERSLRKSGKEFFHEIEIPNLKRDKVSVTNEIKKHEITVIDFWASWCGPCMREMPNIVKLNINYKSKGLGIIGISLDKDYNSWKEAIDANKMSWLQLSDLRGWESDAALANGISSIPYTIIVDGNSNILGKNLRGQELEEFVSKYLSKK